MDFVSLGIIVFIMLPLIALLFSYNAYQKTQRLSRQISSLNAELSELRQGIEERILSVAPSSPPKNADSRSSLDDLIDEDLIDENLFEEGLFEEGLFEEIELTEQRDAPIETPIDNVVKSPLGLDTSKPKVTSKPPNSTNWETLIGQRWSVILGGIAVGLGSIFLVRFVIDNAILGPGGRILVGAALTLALFIAGEYMRRRDKIADFPVINNADVPSILTGTAAIAGFATLYAAHSLYGFIGAPLAFILLTALGLVTMLLSSIHGPKLAALGVIGSYITPLLVTSDAPNPVALMMHVLTVTGVATAIARIRSWEWLLHTAVLGSLAYAFFFLSMSASSTGVSAMILFWGLALIYSVGFGGIPKLADVVHSDQGVDRIYTASIACLLLIFLLYLPIPVFPNVVLTASVLGAIIMLAGYKMPALAVAAIPTSIALAFSVFSLDILPSSHSFVYDFEANLRNNIPQNTRSFIVWAVLIVLPSILIGVWGVFKHGSNAPKYAGYTASAVSLLLFLTLCVSWLRLSPFESTISFGVVAAVIAIGLFFLTDRVLQLRPKDQSAGAPAAYIVGSIALFSLAIGVSVSELWIPFGLAMTALGIAWIYKYRTLRALPITALIVSVIAVAALYLSLPWTNITIGSVPILNKLIILVGLPSLALLTSGELIARQNEEKYAPLISALGLALAALFISLEVRHFMGGGNLWGPFGLKEAATQTICALAFSLGLSRVTTARTSPVFLNGAHVLRVLGAALIVLTLLIIYNPLNSSESVGEGMIFNALFLGYFIPSLLAGWVAYDLRNMVSRQYTLIYAGLSGALMFVYISSMVRKAYQGPYIALERDTTNLELWTYSVVWLAFGALILLLGFRLKAQPVRAVGGALIVITVLKVFLIDLSALEGVLRAASFIGLGLVLIIIGRSYQRLFGVGGKARSVGV